MVWKRYLITGGVVIVVLLIGFFFFSDKINVKNIPYLSTLGPQSRYNSPISFWNLTDLRVDNDTLIFEQGNHQINLTFSALIAGEEYNFGQYVQYQRSFNERAGWIYGANVTIPDSPLGQQIANNLQEIRFNFASTVDLRKLRERDFNFRYYLTNSQNQFFNETSYLEYSFKSLLEKYPDIPKRIEVVDNKHATLVFNVRDVTFRAGQVIDLDPEIVITTISTANSIGNNVSIENNYSHMNTSNQSIVLYMPFDVNFSTTDSDDFSTYGNDGTITSAAYTDSGFIGRGMSYTTGASRVFVPNDPSLAINGTSSDGFTISLWANPSTLESAIIGIIAARNVFSALDWQLYYDGTGGELEFWFGNSGTARLFGGLGISPNLNSWNHIVVTRRATNYSLYLNGNLNASVLDTRSFGADDNISIGALDQAGAFPFRGILDEVMIMNVGLTEQEVILLYNNQSNRFPDTGTQDFNSINVSDTGDENRANLTIANLTHFGSSFNISIGSVSGGSYSYSDEYAYPYQEIPFTTPNNVSVRIHFYPGNSSNNRFYSPILTNFINITSYEVAVGGGDNEYPQFFNITEVPPNASQIGSGHLNISLNINSTNGTAGWEFDGINYSLSNISNYFNASNSSLGNGTYSYYFWAYGNGSSSNYNTTQLYYYTINNTPTITIDVITPPNFNGQNVTQNLFFNVTVNVTCLQADCGDINVSLDPQQTIMLQDADSENQDDTYIAYFNDAPHGSDNFMLMGEYDGATLYHGSIMLRFNITEIPAGAIINEAELGMYGYTESLDTGEFYNVTIHHVYSYPTYSISGSPWDESTITRANNNLTGNYNLTPLDWGYFEDGVIETWHILNVTDAVSQESQNSVSFVIRRNNTNAEIGDDYYFYPKESGNLTFIPYLNITYTDGSGNKSGLISTVVGTTPFYTNESNPRTINLNQSQSQLVTFFVNATGGVGTSHTFFAFANITSTPSINNITNDWIVRIQAPEVSDTCTYTSGNWNVVCPDNCSITSNVVIDSGANVSISGKGSFTVDGGNITNWWNFRVFGQCRVLSVNGGRII